MMYAESRGACEATMERFIQEYTAKYPKAVKSLITDRKQLLTRFDFPAEH